MLPKLSENKQEITDKLLEPMGHVLILLPAGKTLPDMPAGNALKVVMKRRNLKMDALLKSPVVLQLAGGTLAVVAMLENDASPFALHERIRKGLAPLMAEHPKSLVLALLGDAAFKTRVAEAAVYAALVNGVPLPSRKSKPEAALKAIQLSGYKSADGFARVKALAEGNLLTRSLTVQGPDELTPGVYRKRIKALGKQYGWTIEEYSFAKLKKMGAGAFLSLIHI